MALTPTLSQGKSEKRERFFTNVFRLQRKGEPHMSMTSRLIASIILMAMIAQPAVADVTVLFDDTVVQVDQTLADPNDLWVLPADLTRINRFELKPEGACLDTFCMPVRQDVDSAMFVTRAGQGWFNVTELARQLQQAYSVDHDRAVWSFGQIPQTRQSFLLSAIAPDFTLADRQGNPVSLSDFRGKKVLLVTWASW